MEQKDIILGTAMTIAPVYTWTSFATGAAFDGPGWTISTLLFFYLIFPWCGRFVQRRKDATMKWLLYCYLGQLVYAVVFIYITGSFEVATMLPYSRLGVFLMGMFAASDCKRVGSNEEGFDSAFARHGCGCRRRGKEAHQRQSSGGTGTEGACEGGEREGEKGVERVKGGEQVVAVAKVDEDIVQAQGGEFDSGEFGGGEFDGGEGAVQGEWAEYTDRVSLVLALLFLWYTIVDSIAANYGIKWLQTMPVAAGGGLWLQCLGAWPMLMLMVSLTRDGGRSYTAKCLKSSLWKWFGANSMAIYLIHQVGQVVNTSAGHLSHTSIHLPALIRQVVIAYGAALYRCTVQGQSLTSLTSYASPTDDNVTTLPNNELSLTEQTLAKNGLPSWGVLVVVPMSCLLGRAITRFVDEPCARRLRATRKQRPS
jgi:peptidoglycan/LPS O-acetylase OafA/YrhL